MTNETHADTSGQRVRKSETDVLRSHDRLIRSLAQSFVCKGVAKEDLLQEGRLALLMAARSWRPEYEASLWTYGRKFVLGAMFRCVAREANARWDMDVDALDMSGDSTPETSLGFEQCWTSVCEEVAALPARQREALRLRFKEDLGFKEIGQAMGLPLSTAYELTRTAIETVRERITARL